MHRLVFEDGRFHLDGSSARVIGPEHVGNKDAVVFNLADGRVALMHRIHPNMQMAVFDSLDAMWHADGTRTGTITWSTSTRTRSSPRHRVR